MSRLQSSLHRNRWLICAAVAACAFSAAGEPVVGAEAVASDVDYVRDVKPLFAKHCGKCHGAEKQENGLRLDSAAGALAGGDTGPAVVPGKSAESLLILAVTGTSDDFSQMPPKGPRLSDSQIAMLARWIDAGAKATDERPAVTAKSDHWSFQPVGEYLPPAVHDSAWPRNAIDSFVLARLEAEGVAPSLAAERATLIRRVALDLVGLPPTPEEVQAFVADERPDAYERLVDRLLASPHYGERWGRHWLDVARYADSNGYTIDSARQIWKYREWVIAAINRDQPFDQFTIEQMAGDMLPGATTEQLVATGFHRNTLKNEEGGTDQEQFRVEAIVDRVSTVGAAYLGLTLGCARCHTHKYDPITQVEFYQIFALLNSCDEPTLEAPSRVQIAAGDLQKRDEIRAKIKQLTARLKSRAMELKTAQDDWEKNLSDDERFNKLPQPVKAAIDQPVANRSPKEWKLIEDHFRQLPAAREAFPALDEIAKLKQEEPKIETTLIVRERAQPRETFVHRRGNFLDPGQQVTGDVPAVLPPLKTQASDGGNRLDFARWLVAPENPLTPRVVMNRDWQKFFGRGIVETEDDFGLQGTPPTHLQLLDFLAGEFLRSGWDVKRMRRQMVTSGTYRQASHVRTDLAERDPYNLLLARQVRQRLDAEIVRDVSLASAGLLTNVVGGPSVFPPQPGGVYAFTQTKKNWVAAEGSNRYRRGMYTYFWRSAPYPQLMTFDAPTGNFTCTRRLRSNTPLQALTLANDEAFVECSEALAQRVLHEVPAGDAERIRYAFELCLSREPSAAERELLGSLLLKERKERPAEAAAWTAVCRVLLNLDETITRE
jgi:mono/diheme cytochrome c family protein